LAYTYALYQGFIRTLLCLAAHRGYEKIVKAMIAAGADVNKKDTWGGTALFDAAMAGHSKVVKMLLKAGAKTDIERREGGTPAAIARRMGFHEIADEIEHCNR